MYYICYNTGCPTDTVRIRTWVANMDTPVIYGNKRLNKMLKLQ